MNRAKANMNCHQPELQQNSRVPRCSPTQELQGHHEKRRGETSPIKTSSMKHAPRIPLELQQVFLASNRGQEVDKAPKHGFFVRRWFARPKEQHNNPKRGLSFGKDKTVLFDKHLPSNEHIPVSIKHRWQSSSEAGSTSLPRIPIRALC